MPSCNLTIGQKMPLGTWKGQGPRTVYVWPIKNWPQPTGETEPTVSADIDIEIQCRMGEVVVVRTSALPYNGLKAEVSGDEISIWAEYHNRQALGTPYNVYSIRADCQPGWHPATRSVFHWKVDVTTLPAYYMPPTGDIPTIPAFTRQFRLKSKMSGWFAMQALNGVTGGNSDWWWSFRELRNWVQIPPNAYYWRMGAYSVDRAGIGGTAAWGNAALEFE